MEWTGLWFIKDTVFEFSARTENQFDPTLQGGVEGTSQKQMYDTFMCKIFPKSSGPDIVNVNQVSFGNTKLVQKSV